MNRYKMICELGGGAYGMVYKAQHVTTGEIVAIKQIRRTFASWEECLAIREVASLSKLKHEYIVRLKELVHEQGILWFVFEFIPSNLYKTISEAKAPLAEHRIRHIMRQIITGLQHMHKHGFFHRDIKPENLLCDAEDNIKIADFGLARETRSRPPYTEYVSTRWYRAPELLLRTSRYNSPIDMWAAGCIMAELYLRHPLFPGTNEINQMQCIVQVLGTPSKQVWANGVKAARNINFRFPKCSRQDLAVLIPSASRSAITLMRDLLKYDPFKRPSATAALGYGFFSESKDPEGTLSRTGSRRNSFGQTERVSLLIDEEEVLTPAEESPSVRCRIFPRDRSNSLDGSDKFDGSPRTRTLRPVNSFRKNAGAGTGAGAGAPRSGPASAGGALLKSDISLDASAMEDLIDELEADFLGRRGRD